jgi:CRISPR-associated protein Cmr5
MSRQRTYAHRAHKIVTDKVESASGDDLAKFRTLCMKSPALIQQSGLAQALTFLLAREKQGKKFVEALASAWNQQDDKQLHQAALSTEGLLEYMKLTREIIDVAIWFRRFAQIEIPTDDQASGSIE